MTKDNKRTADGLKARLAAKAAELNEKQAQYAALIHKAEEKARSAEAALEAAESGTDPEAYVRAKGALSAAQDEREFYALKLQQLDEGGLFTDTEYHTTVQDVQAAALTERQLMEKDIRGLARRMGEIAAAYDADINVLDEILGQLNTLKPNQPRAYANKSGPSGVLQFATHAGKWELTLPDYGK